MFLRLFLLFSLIPLIELFILLRIGAVIGSINTILLVIITGVVGAYLAQSEGARTLHKIRDLMDQGQMPGDALLDALLILIAGIVLLTPGIMTDFMGLLLLIPVTRTKIRDWIKIRLEQKLSSSNVTINYKDTF